jgi:16S rRNA (cytidine1402-2'-O)-methyltransferase
MSSTSGTLWVAATPIGNLSDASPRLIQTLDRARAVLAEDTRRTGLLCKALGAAPRRFVSLHEHNETARKDLVLELLDQGGELVLVSDAGTPLVSDPGYELVRAARAAGHAVAPLPGPSAVTAALSASGLPPQPFAFLGFAPRKGGDLARFFAPWAETPATLVYFERKSRLAAGLEAARQALGDRECCLARELTKVHEGFIVDRLENLAGSPPDLKGEITVVLGPPPQPERAGVDAARAALQAAAGPGIKPRETARRAAAGLPGWSVKEVYARMESLRGGAD